MSIVRSPVRSVVRSPVQGVFGGSASLLEQATSALGNVAPYHWLDFINNRALYAGADVGNVTQATGYSFTRASDGYYTNADGTLTLFGSGALRRGDRGVLIEGARTNLLLRSQEFDNVYWLKQRGSISGSSAGPDGTMQGFVEDSATNSHRVVINGVTVAASTTHTFSCFLKAGTRTAAYLSVQTGSANEYVAIVANLANGTISATSVGATLGTIVSSSITSVANGAYRVSLSYTLGASTLVYPVIGISNSATPSFTTNGDVSYAGDGTSGVFIWGAQLEQASFQSSYIPTVAAAATRAADVLTYTAGVSYPLQLWSEFERAVDTGGNEGIVTVDDGDATDRAGLIVNGTDQLEWIVVTASALQAQIAAGSAIALGSVIKGAGRVATNDAQAVRSGTLGTADTSVTLPATPTLLTIGARSAALNPLFGYIRRIAVIQGAGTDANLIAMTS